MRRSERFKKKAIRAALAATMFASGTSAACIWLFWAFMNHMGVLACVPVFITGMAGAVSQAVSAASFYRVAQNETSIESRPFRL